MLLLEQCSQKLQQKNGDLSPRKIASSRIEWKGTERESWVDREPWAWEVSGKVPVVDPDGVGTGHRHRHRPPAHVDSMVVGVRLAT